MSFNAPASREGTCQYSTPFTERPCTQLIAHRHRPVTSSASTEAFFCEWLGEVGGTAPCLQAAGRIPRAAAHPASACFQCPCLSCEGTPRRVRAQLIAHTPPVTSSASTKAFLQSLGEDGGTDPAETYRCRGSCPHPPQATAEKPCARQLHNLDAEK